MRQLWALAAWCICLVGACFTVAQAQVNQAPPEIYAQTGHPNDRSDAALAVAPDGLRLASVSVQFPTVKLWDIASGREWRTLRGHQGGLAAVAYSPDGRRLASGGADKTIRLWDAATGAALKVLEGHTDAVIALAFTPDGRTVISSSVDKTVRLWDVTSGQLLCSLPLPPGVLAGSYDRFNSLAVSSDGRLLVAVGDPAALVIWNLAAAPTTAPRLLKLPAGDGGAPKGLALSPDGQRLAFIRQVKNADRVHLWDVQTGRELATGASAHRTSSGLASLYTLAFDAGGLAAGDSANAIQLWDAELRLPARVIPTTGVVSWIGSGVAFLPGGQTIALATHDGTVSLWDRSSGRNLAQLGGVTSMVKSLALSPDGKTLVAGGRSRHLEQWNTADGRRERRVLAFDDQIEQVAIAPDGASVMASCYGSCTREENRYRVRAWALDSGRQTKDLAMLSPFAMAPDGKTYASFYPGSNSVPGIWRTQDDTQACKLPGKVGEEGWYFFAEYSPDSRYLAVGYQKGKVIIWDVPNCRHVRTLLTHSDGDGVPPVAFSPDSRRLSTGCATRALSNCSDTAVRTYRVDDGQLVAEFNASSVTASLLRYTPDGRLLIGATGDEIKVWDAASGAVRRSWVAHPGGVTQLLVSADGRLLYTSGNDGSIRRWDLANGTEQAQFISFNDGEWVVITPQGYYDSSEKGDQYLNVRIGAQVFGMASYRERFYRPDVVRLALDGAATVGGGGLAQVGVAPLLSLLDVPATVQGDSLNLQVQVQDQGGGIGELRVYLNGTAVQARDTRTLRPVANTAAAAPPVRLSLPVRLLPGSNQIRVLAFNADGSMSSNPAQATVQSQLVTANPSTAALPRLHALVVGIQEFENSAFNLQYTRVDAVAMQQALQARAQGLFSAVNIQLLTERSQTTKEAIRAAFARMQREVAPDDVFIFYVASHGVIDGENLADMSYYLITANVGSAATRYLKRDALSQDELRRLIADIPATKKLVLLDTCHAGDVGSRLLGRGLQQDAAVKLLSRSTGVAVIAASTSAQQALEGHQGHGVFTYALLQGLSGKADAGRKGYVTALSLADYVTEEVPELTERVFKMKQYPTFNIEGQPFPIVRTP